MTDLENMASALEASNDYRVIRRLRQRSIINPPDGSETRLAIFFDVETTGTKPSDEIIELAMVPFTYGEDGRIFEIGEPFQGFNQPSSPIPAEATRVNGITDEMVAGHRLNPDQVAAFIGDARLIIAHNAAFDRPFAERLCPEFTTKHWACSMSQIDWIAEGFESAKLYYLAMEAGFFYDKHRAADDCVAGIELLSRALPQSRSLAMARMLETARLPTYRIVAEGSPYEMRGLLKARGYRWDDDHKSWWIEVLGNDPEAELGWLRAEIYQQSDRHIPAKRIMAIDRFSNRY